MNDVLLLLLGVALGVLAAIPIGPCQIETVKRAVSGHLLAALVVALGSVTSDVVYGGVALFGLAPFMEVPRVLAIFSAIGGLIMWVLAYFTWKESRRPRDFELGESSLRRKRWAYLTGLTLGLSNPPLVVSWLFGIALAKRFGLATPLTHAAKVTFIAGGGLGLGGYLVVLAFVTHRVRHFLSQRALARVYRWLSVVLLVLSLYFVRSAIVYVVRGR